uniref:Transcription repressor n=1 Tax=Salix viminalis TaxID=40686 RepID=A0A6N2KWT7_SALVM
MKASRVDKKQKLQQRGCKAFCCSCRLSVSSSEEGESSNSDQFASISSLAHAMVQERLDQMIRERQEARQREKRRRPKSDGAKFIVMVAMEKSSYDPREDFRDSMVEMIMANRLQETKDLRSLLNYYVTMNSEEYHGMILEVFHESAFSVDGYSEGSVLPNPFMELILELLLTCGAAKYLNSTVRMIVAPYATINMVTERKRNVNPIINLSGSVCLESLNRNGDERIEKNVTADVKEKAAAKATVAMRTATTEQPSAVIFSRSLAKSRRSEFAATKNPSAVSLLVLS